jgi:hypothetical protein
VKLRVRRRPVPHVGELAEDAHHVLAADERNRAHLDRHPIAVEVDHRHLGIGDRFVPDHLSREHFAGATGVLRSHDGRELAAANVADDALTRRVHPADHAVDIDDVARHVDALERLLDPHRLQNRQWHATQCRSRTTRGQMAARCQRRLARRIRPADVGRARDVH